MNRILFWIVIALALGSAACRKSEAPQPADPEVNASGHFLSDSLGVSLYLPESAGWSFRRDPPVPGAPYITAVHKDSRATVRLYVTSLGADTELNDVVEIRRAQLASGFGVKSLDDVVSQVLRDEQQPWDGHPAIQWQAVSEVMAMDDTPSRIMFTWLATSRPRYVYECLSMVLFLENPTPAERVAIDALLDDTSEIMESFRLR